MYLNPQPRTCGEALCRLLMFHSTSFLSAPPLRLQIALEDTNSHLRFFISTQGQHYGLGNCSQAGMVIGFILWTYLLSGIDILWCLFFRTNDLATYILFIFIVAAGRKVIVITIILSCLETDIPSFCLPLFYSLPKNNV